MRTSILHTVHAMTCLFIGVGCGGVPAPVKAPDTSTMQVERRAVQGAILDVSPRSETIALLMTYPTGILSTSAPNSRCISMAFDQISSGETSLTSALRALGLTPEVHVEALHTSLFMTVPRDDLDAVRNLLENLKRPAKSEITDHLKDCSEESRGALLHSEFHPQNVKIFIAAEKGFPIDPWHPLSVGRTRETPKVPDASGSGEVNVRRSESTQSEFTLTFPISGASVVDLATGDVAAHAICRRLALSLRSTPPRISGLACRVLSPVGPASLEVKITFRGAHQSLWSDILDTLKTVSTLPISAQETREAAHAVHTATQRLDTSPKHRLLRLARLWTRHGSSLGARREWNERISRLSTGNTPDASMVSLMTAWSDPDAIDVDFLVHEEDEAIALAFVGEALKEAAHKRWAETGTTNDKDRLSGVLAHHHGPDHTNDVFEIRFHGGRSQAMGAFTGAADLTASLLRLSLKDALVLTTEHDIRIRIVSSPDQLPGTLVNLRNSMRSLQTASPERLERARRDALHLADERITDGDAQFEDSLSHLGASVSKAQPLDWSAHAAQIKNLPDSVIKPWAQRFVRDARISISWIGPTPITHVRSGLFTVLGRTARPSAGLNRPSRTAAKTPSMHIPSDRPRHGRVYALPSLSASQSEALHLLDESIRLEMGVLLKRELGLRDLRVHVMGNDSGGYLIISLAQTDTPLMDMVQALDSTLEKLRQVSLSKESLDRMKTRRVQSVLAQLSDPLQRVQWMNDRLAHSPAMNGESMVRQWRAIIDGLSSSDVQSAAKAVFSKKTPPTILQGITGRMTQDSTSQEGLRP